MVKVLIDPGEYSLTNVGDAAMLQVAVARLRECLGSQAEIRVLTDAPARLAVLCPRTVMVPAAGRVLWFGEHFLLGRLSRGVPSCMSVVAVRIQRQIRRRAPALARFLVRLKRLGRSNNATLEQFLAAIRVADALVLSGQGSINDAFRGHALQILETIAHFQDRHLTVVMLGQGLGPVSDDVLLRRIRDVLPAVSLIGLRDRISSPQLVKVAGVDRERWTVTGDDVLQLMEFETNAAVSTAIGLSIRLAVYSVDDSVLVGRAIATTTEAANELNATVRPVAMSTHPDEDDASVLRRYLQVDVPRDELITPQCVLQRIRGCRVMVAGSYHAAVLALGQGIPVVCLAFSEYYMTKFGGVQDLFPSATWVVGSADLHLLHSHIIAAWHTPARVRENLIQSARSQASASRDFYVRVCSLLESS